MFEYHEQTLIKACIRNDNFVPSLDGSRKP